jgi:anti-sigma factor RsiW
MTRRHDLSLVDDLIDNELSPELAAEVQKLIEASPEWRERYQETTRLVTALRQKKIADPGEIHWVESANRVIDRTAARHGYDDRFITKQEYRAGVGSLVRSMLSLAASIAILAATIYLGARTTHASRPAPNSHPILVAAPMADPVHSYPSAFTDRETQIRLARAVMLLGNPGILGRAIGLAEIQPHAN